MAVFAILYWLVNKSDESVSESGNQYSIKHLEYNQLFLDVNLRATVLVFLSVISYDNFGLRLGAKCLDCLFLAILMAMRTVIVLYTVVFIFPDTWTFLKMTYTLNDDNWWQS